MDRDKFTKTTETDISNMSLMEEETPQKSKVGTVISIIVSLILSVSLWLYVVDSDDNKIEKAFEDIEVQIINPNPNYDIHTENVTVILIGTKSNLVDVDKSEIIVEISGDDINKEGEYSIKAHNVYIDDDSDLAVEVKDVNLSVKVNVEGKK